jgi:hypothetical protein
MYLTPGPGPKTFAVISNLQTGKSDVVVASDGSPESLHWCNYSAPARAVCLISANVNMEGYLVGMQRLMAMNTDGTEAKLLGQPDRHTDEYLRQVDAQVLDWRGGADGSVLMERQYVPEAGKIETNIVDSREGLGVDLVDTRTLRSTPVELPNKSASDYMTDGRGHVRVMEVVEDDHGQVTGRVKYYYRTADSRGWKTLVDYQKDQFEPLAIDADLDSLYALRKKNGRYALYRIKLDGSLAETLIASNPSYDIDDVVRIGDGQRVVGYSYEGEKGEVKYFDPEFDALAASLSKALPNLPIVEFVDATADGRKLLIYAGSDTDPGRFYLFDRDRKTLNEAMLERPELEGRALARVKPVSIPSADGAQIPAYLTLPPGKDAKNLPAVVLPHGGPSARDAWGFAAMRSSSPSIADPPVMARNGRMRTGSRIGARRWATSRRRRGGSHRRASPTPNGSRSSAGRTAAMPRSRRPRPIRNCTRRSRRSPRSPTCRCSRMTRVATRTTITSRSSSDRARTSSKARRRGTLRRSRCRCSWCMAISTRMSPSTSRSGCTRRFRAPESRSSS